MERKPEYTYSVLWGGMLRTDVAQPGYGQSVTMVSIIRLAAQRGAPRRAELGSNRNEHG